MLIVGLEPGVQLDSPRQRQDFLLLRYDLRGPRQGERRLPDADREFLGVNVPIAVLLLLDLLFAAVLPRRHPFFALADPQTDYWSLALGDHLLPSQYHLDNSPNLTFSSLPSVVAALGNASLPFPIIVAAE